MLGKDEIKRYDRQIKVKSIGMKGQENLKKARVLIIGAGGLGCPALQYLSAAGIGNITVMDGDTVSESNLQRQILFNHNETGKYKAEIAVIKAQLINPFVNLHFINEFLTVQSALQLFPDYDLILDCCDNFGTRYLINDVCTLYKLPFVSSALYQTEGQIGVFNVELSEGVFSTNYRDVFTDVSKSNASLNCNEAGVISTLPGIMGILQANEVLKYFIDKTSCCIDQLIIFNTISLNQFNIQIEANALKPILSKTEIQNTDYNLPCLAVNNDLVDDDTLPKLLKEELFIVDVREFNELPIVNSDLIYNSPLSSLETNSNFFADKNRILFVCKSGMRSKKALDLMKAIYPDKQCYSYKNGIEHLLEKLNN